MSEDQVLQEIRVLTTKDEMPFDKMMRAIIERAKDALKEYEAKAANHTGIIHGNILTYIISMGIQEAIFIQDAQRVSFPITPKGIGIVPASQIYVYINGTTAYLNTLSQHQFVLKSQIPFVGRANNGSNPYIKYGMLFISFESGLYIVPHPSLLQIYPTGVRPVGGIHFISFSPSSLSQEVLNWLHQ